MSDGVNIEIIKAGALLGGVAIIAEASIYTAYVVTTHGDGQALLAVGTAIGATIAAVATFIVKCMAAGKVK